MKKTKPLLLALSMFAGLGVIAAACSPAAQPSSSSAPAEASGSVGEQVDHKIIGIDPGAGLMNATEKAMQEYGLSDYELVEGSSAAMTAALAESYKNKKPIIITGWTPHWMFSKYELKYLKDPKGVYGKDEEIHTIAKKGLKEEMPSAYAFLDKFEWEPADMEKVMLAITDGKSPEEAAADWVGQNQEKVNKWVEGIKPEAGKKISLAYVAWDSEIASTNVVKQVLEDKLKYQVEMNQVEAGPMWVGISNGDADAMVAAWLPTTHADYAKKLKGQFEDLGPNLKGTKLGLVVPTYMNIESIEDLKK